MARISLEVVIIVCFYKVMSSSLMASSSSRQKRTARGGQLKHLQISRAIEQEIADGVLPPGAQLPTEAQLMERFGVSRITVRRALQGLTQEGTLIARQGSGTFVNPSHMASVYNLLFIHASESPISYPYTAHILEGVRRVADVMPPPFRVHLAAMPPIQQQSADDTAIEEQVAYTRCRGVISLARLHPAAMKRLTEAGVAVVMIGGLHFVDLPEGVMGIGIGVAEVLEEALTYMKAAGRRKIAIVRGETTDSSLSNQRLMRTSTRLGLSIPPSQLEYAMEWGANSGARAMARLLERCPDLDAVIAGDDLIALGALHTLWKRGIKVPEQVALLGMGNLLGEHSHCGISTLDLQLRQQGELAAHSILQRLHGQPVKPVHLVQPRFLHRETTLCLQSTPLP